MLALYKMTDSEIAGFLAMLRTSKLSEIEMHVIDEACSRLLRPTRDYNGAKALADLRHFYANLVNGGVRDMASAKQSAVGLLAPTIAWLEAAGDKDA